MSVSDLPWLLLAGLSKRYDIDGLDIRIAASAAEATRTFEKLVAALQLIGQYDPQFHALIHEKLRMLLLTEAAGGHYIRGLRAARIGVSYAQRLTALELAMTIVHETTHAAIEDAGEQYVGKNRERIERQCVTAEIEFATKVPGHGDAVAGARALLETRWWEEERRAANWTRQLRDSGLPTWLAKRIVNWTTRKERRE